MAPGPAFGENEDSSGKNQNVVVKSEAVCTNNCENDALHAAKAAGDPVARVGSSYDKVEGNVEPVKDEHGDTTEYSSSFGNSCSLSNDEITLDPSGVEVDSPVLAHNDVDPATFDGPPRLFRKKKVSAEWRGTVRPLMWRFQWLQLRMKSLMSQVSKYDRELAQIKHEKDLQSGINKTDVSVSELVQRCKGQEKSSIKRRKRERHEDTVDSSLYIKKHQILSYYYEKRSKGADTDGLSVVDDHNGPVREDFNGSLDTDELLELEESKSLEQLTLRGLLLRIDGIQSRVLELQDRLNEALRMKEKIASSVDHTHVKVVQEGQKTQNHSSSCKKNRNTSIQKKKDINILLQEKDGDRPLPNLSGRATNCLMEDVEGNSVEKGGDSTHLDKKATAVKLLLGADTPQPDGHLGGDFGKENTDDVLIDNQAANREYRQFEKVKHLPEKPTELVNVAETATSEVENTSATVAMEESVIETPPDMKAVYSGKKRGRKPKKKNMASKAASKNRSEKAPNTLDSNKEKTENVPKTPPDVKQQKTENTFPTCGAKTQKTENTITTRRAKKQKTEKECKTADAKKQQTENPVKTAYAKKQKTENTHKTADGKIQKTENARKTENAHKTAVAKKQRTENARITAEAKKQKTESTPSKLKIEKAVLVVRRSKRIRKPKVY